MLTSSTDPCPTLRESQIGVHALYQVLFSTLATHFLWSDPLCQRSELRSMSLDTLTRNSYQSGISPVQVRVQMEAWTTVLIRQLALQVASALQTLGG